jgi:NAD(P)-dependent dehydrogenase (short-subunit alcohol dehydrogenase family)
MNSVILITGANGLLGTCITNHLSTIKDHHVCAIDLGSSPATSIDNDIDYFQLDLVDSQSIDTILLHISELIDSNCHLSVIHLAAIDQKNVMESNQLPHEESLSKILNSFNVNAFVSIRLLQAFTSLALEKGASMSFIYVPSLYCYHAPNPNLYGGYNQENLPFKQKSLAYVSSKGGIVSAIKLFASTYARKRLRFNCLVPHGVVNDANEVFTNQFSLFSPAGRTSMPSDLLPAIDFLVDPNNNYFTGQSLFIDGGWSTL